MSPSVPSPGRRQPLVTACLAACVLRRASCLLALQLRGDLHPRQTPFVSGGCLDTTRLPKTQCRPTTTHLFAPQASSRLPCARKCLRCLFVTPRCDAAVADQSFSADEALLASLSQTETPRHAFGLQRRCLLRLPQPVAAELQLDGSALDAQTDRLIAAVLIRSSRFFFRRRPLSERTSRSWRPSRLWCGDRGKERHSATRGKKLGPARTTWAIHKARRYRPGHGVQGRSHVDNPLKRANSCLGEHDVGCPQGAAAGLGMIRSPAPWGQPLGIAITEQASAPGIGGGELS